MGSLVTPDSILRALGTMRSHPAVAQVHEPNTTAGGTTVLVDMRVVMPQQWIADGGSPFGVRAIEPVTFRFSSSFPEYAPRLTLRGDFDRTLAHVQPGSIEDPPEPCILYGSVDELLQQRGIDGILHQLSDWLSKAAQNSLIDPKQGWEPVRRDVVPDTVFANTVALEQLIGGTHGKTFLEMHYWRIHKQCRTIDLYAYLGEQVPVNKERLPDLLGFRDVTEEIERGVSIAVIMWPAKTAVAGRYLPETVTTLGDLRARAEQYGCADIFKSVIDHLRISFKDVKVRTAPVVFILCARRPYPLIGSPSSIEFCMYRIDAQPHTPFPDGDKTGVYPAGQRDGITQDLLRRVSGVGTLDGQWALIGAGSLGSKLGLHLARAGLPPAVVIDRDDLEAHNAARHALLPEAGPLLLKWRDHKAQHMSGALQAFDAKVAHIDADIRRVLADPEKTAEAFGDVHVIVNATASLVVRDVLASTPLLPRVLEGALFNNALVGVLTLEGTNRNPNTGYLISEVYQVMQSHPYRERFFGSNITGNIAIGQGCSSATFIASDAQISAHAAPMAGELQRLLTCGLPQQGKIQIGITEGMSSQWTTHNVPACQVVSIDHQKDWHIQLGDRAHQKITAEVSTRPNVETGGILIGRFSEIGQTFYVTDVLAAPEDTKRTAALFTLGTIGVKSALQDIARATNGALYCLGTWHSHLATSGPSSTDKATAQAIGVAQLLPAVLLVHTPGGYRALLALKDPSNG